MMNVLISEWRIAEWLPKGWTLDVNESLEEEHSSFYTGFTNCVVMGISNGAYWIDVIPRGNVQVERCKDASKFCGMGCSGECDPCSLANFSYIDGVRDGKMVHSLLLRGIWTQKNRFDIELIDLNKLESELATKPESEIKFSDFGTIIDSNEYVTDAFEIACKKAREL
jgi:hypothetical protein